MKNLIHNELKIKCEDPDYYKILRSLLVAKDEYGSEYLTMKNFIPMPEGYDLNTGYTKHGEDWCWEQWGTKADVISDFIHEEDNQLWALYHTISNPNDKWIKTLTMHLSHEFNVFSDQELPLISIEHKYYDLDRKEGGYFYWDTRYYGNYHRYGILEFASKYHPGLVNYFIDQERFQEDEKDSFYADPQHNPNQIEENTVKNNIIKKEEKCQNT